MLKTYHLAIGVKLEDENYPGVPNILFSILATDPLSALNSCLDIETVQALEDMLNNNPAGQNWMDCTYLNRYYLLIQGDLNDCKKAWFEAFEWPEIETVVSTKIRLYKLIHEGVPYLSLNKPIKGDGVSNEKVWEIDVRGGDMSDFIDLLGNALTPKDIEK